jgi:type IV fimbrial biogenesis protein FimT
LAANSTSACSAGGAATWTNGWLVFMDLNGDGVVDASDEIIRVQQAPPNIASILNPNPGSTRPKFTYQANGWAKSVNDTLIFTPRGTVPAGVVRCVIVASTGRPSVVASGDAGCP